MKPTEAFEAAKKTYSEKNPIYAEQWREYETISLSDILRGKAVRIKEAIKQNDAAQALEELEDAMNYAAFAWCKVKEGETDETPTA